MNPVDAAILLCVLLSALSGYRRGAVLQLIVYAGLLIGLFVGALVAPSVAGLAKTPFLQAALALGVLLAVAAVGDAAGWFVGARVWSLARRSPFAVVDSVAGSAVALVAVLLAVWFIGFNLANGPFPVVSRHIRSSVVMRELDQLLPRPPSVLADVRRFFNRFGFPEVFADLPPAPAGPVEGPTKGQAAAAAGRARDSTVRIVGTACGATQEGSGFVGAARYIVTNAHVVAGARGIEVQEQNGPSQRAVPVLFDPRLDIAVLRVAASPGPVLSLEPEDEERGTKGAVLGYPGGGSLRYSRAAVRRELRAIGRDIYGRSLVRRDVYELQATVTPGNSGGPFVLTDGRVSGVVFAASTTDPRLAYAIASPSVLRRVDEATGRTRAVSTGECVR